MPSKDAISVGVLSYNRPKLLRNALESVSRQTVAPAEVIISDNASSDPEIDHVVEEFARNHRNAKIFRHDKNRGAFWNFRFVLEEAQSDLFIWLADDDFWSPDFLESLLKVHSDGRPSLVYPRCIPINLETGKHGIAVKERSSRCAGLKNALAQTIFDTDSMIYGLMDTEVARKFTALLTPWPVPGTLARRFPTLTFDFTSYAFLYGLLLKCDFVNARETPAVHFMVDRPVQSNVDKTDWRLFRIPPVVFTMVYIHVLLAWRFVRAAVIARSPSGVLLAPFAAVYLFLRRLAKAALRKSQSLNSAHT